MTTTTTAFTSRSLIEEILPGLDQRCEAYHVTDEQPDRETLAAFLDYLRELLGQLEAAIDTGNLPAAAQSAHALKGMGGAVGAPEISVLGEEMERMARRGQDLGVCQLCDVLRRWFLENGGRDV